MPNWTEAMNQTFEYYVVDPGTWMNIRPLNNVLSCTINRDNDSETLGSATIDIDGTLNECYVRVYLVTIQNGVTEKHPLGTFLVQTPSSNRDGKTKQASMDAYTPLIELKENPPPIGYSIPKGENVLSRAMDLTREHLRAPVVRTSSSTTLAYDFVANTNDTWLTYIRDLISNDKRSFALDELGRILYEPIQDIATLQPVWEYNDDNSSILYPNFNIEHDMYGLPNVVEVLYSNGKDSFYSKVVNDDPNSPISTVNRGREITRRIIDPDMVGIPTQAMIDEYATQMLRSLSSLEYTVTYTHGYCPVRVGDCVRLNYTSADIHNVKAKVISQSIQCVTKTPVTEKAIFTARLWG